MSVVFFMLFAGTADAQRRFSKTYPAGDGVRLDLLNRTGTVTVEGWNRPEISISASLEAPAALVQPQDLSGRIVIDVVKDNAGRGDVGNVNFYIRVPYYSAVDIETRIGNLKVTNIRSALVRAHVSAEGDIELTNIVSKGVSAENVSGDIFFDGEIQSGGYYRFSSMQGTINLRIPFPSNFKLMATAPSTRSINLGYFSGGGMRTVGDGRRIVGQAGDGSASIQITNQRGTIAFIRR
ncbi:MAG TPA: DUF4097 family beta strand repeat-containing protein [Pyrinomonadaceae bacterium]|nr:DUF4097 family beta strand repeat-containing protein [Pyrinomonadaceae bacterium]